MIPKNIQYICINKIANIKVGDTGLCYSDLYHLFYNDCDKIYSKEIFYNPKINDGKIYGHIFGFDPSHVYDTIRIDVKYFDDHFISKTIYDNK